MIAYCLVCGEARRFRLAWFRALWTDLHERRGTAHVVVWKSR